jgi:hypothetical protein
MSEQIFSSQRLEPVNIVLDMHVDLLKSYTVSNFDR